MFAAVRSGDLSRLEALVATEGANTRDPSGTGQTTLHIAAGLKDPETSLLAVCEPPHSPVTTAPERLLRPACLFLSAVFCLFGLLDLVWVLLSLLSVS